MPYNKSKPTAATVVSGEIPRRKRGRPRKHPLPPPPEEQQLQSLTRDRSLNRTPTRSALKIALSAPLPAKTSKTVPLPPTTTNASLVVSDKEAEGNEPPTKIPKKRGRKPKSYYEELARQAQARQLAEEEARKASQGVNVETIDQESYPADFPSSSSLKLNSLGTGSSKAPALFVPMTPPSSVRRSGRHRPNDELETVIPSLSCPAPNVVVTALKDSNSNGFQLSFQTCLNHVDLQALCNEMRPWHSFDGSGGSLQEPSPRSLPVVVLKRALSIQELGDESWLSSSFMDLVITQFAKTYPCVRYFSVDFARLHANDTKDEVTDILGRSWRTSFDMNSPGSSLIFFVNAQNIHWTLIRVILVPQPELQFFEPMGMPSRSRHVGLNYRTVPKSIIDWLDKNVSLPNDVSWLNIGTSVVTKAHQVTSYDCGVACLLYAEKCGQGQSKEQINLETTQQDITEYRKVLQDFMSKLDS